MGLMVSLKLPPLAGPHCVSCTDVMVGLGKEGSFFRLFYPCDPAPMRQHPLWLPREEYVHSLLGSQGWDSKIIQYCASKILGHPALPVTWNSPFVSGNDRKPLVIFSPGLRAIRTVYSAVCMELASQGFLVAVIEHRDGSACATYHYGDAPDEPLQEIWVPFRKVEPGMKEFYLRNYQLHYRASECVRAVQTLRDIDIGKEVSNILQTDFILQSLKDRIDFGRVAVMGHSFGGASALLNLAKDNIFRCAVALDAWMFPLKNNVYPHIQKPVLFINSETFQTAQNVQKMMRLKFENKENKILTVLGSDHQNQTDFAFLTGSLVNKIFGLNGKIDPQQCMEVNVVAALNFLQKHLDLDGDFPMLDNLSEEIRALVFQGSPQIHSSKL